MAQSRKSTGVRENDLIDLMIDCIEQEDSMDSNSNPEATSEQQYEQDMHFTHHANNKSITEDMVIATAMVMLVAGYDTTGMSLSSMAYYLAKHPDIQAKLQVSNIYTTDLNGPLPG